MVEVCLTEDNKRQMEHIFKKHECIQQGVKKIDRGGFFSDGYAIITVLVPEKNVISFNKDN